MEAAPRSGHLSVREMTLRQVQAAYQVWGGLLAAGTWRIPRGGIRMHIDKRGRGAVSRRVRRGADEV